MLELLKQKMIKTLEIGENALTIGKKWGVEETASRILGEIRERFEFPSVRIAVVGKIKTGKSTLLNALLGKNILPSGILPCTVCDVLVRRSEDKERFFVETEENEILNISINEVKDFLAAGKARNAKKAELFIDSPILKNGLRFYDTPGYSDIDELRSEVVYTILPSSEAVIVVLSAVTGGIGAEELEFLKNRVFASQRSRVFFVINKADLLNSESEVEETLKFVQEKLSFIPGEVHVYITSALHVVEGKSDSRFTSSLEKLKIELEVFFQDHYAEIFTIAARQQLNNLVNGIEGSLKVQKTNLSQSAEDVQKQINEFKSKEISLKEEIQLRKNESLKKIDPVLDAFRIRLNSFAKRYKDEIADTVQNKLSLEDIANDSGKIQRLLAAGIERSYRDFLEKDSSIIQEQINKIEEQFMLDIENWINSSIGSGHSVGSLKLPDQKLNLAEKLINPALLFGAYIGLGWFNFILATFVGYNFADVIKEMVLKQLAGAYKVRERLFGAIEEHLEKLSSQIYVDFAKSLRGNFEKYLTGTSARFNQQFELIQQGLEKLQARAMDPESKITLGEIERDLISLAELRKQI